MEKRRREVECEVVVVSVVGKVGLGREFCSGGLGAALLLGAKGREEGGMASAASRDLLD